MVAEFGSIWQQNDTSQRFCLCLMPPRSFAQSLSPCRRFRPCRCTSFLRFVVFSPHSSVLASAVTAVVLRVLLLFFLFLALFVLLSVLLTVICARPLPFFCCFLACCCCFFCASPFSFCFPCFSLLFVRALCLLPVDF